MTVAELEPQRARRGQGRYERWIVLAVALLLLAALAVPQALRRLLAESAGAAAAPNIGPPAKPSTAGEFRGITIQLQSYWDGTPFEKFVEEIAQTGANTVCLAVAAYQENSGSNSLFIEYRKVPSVERLAKLVRLCHDRGLRVVMMPIVLLENPGTGEWRGKINPPNPDSWWEDYENFVLFYAQEAEASKVDLFMVGSELVSIEDQTDRWRNLIRKARKAFTGRLSYSANWDHYEDIEWWHDLDLVGMTSYYDLVGDKKPSLEVLMEAWEPIKKKVLIWQKKVNMPILFTEVGWPSQEGCAKEPWNYYGSTKPDCETQTMCFDAFFRTWRDEPTISGFLIWEWRNEAYQVGGDKDFSYVPCGKPVMRVIREFFQSPGGAPKLERLTPGTMAAPSASAPARAAADASAPAGPEAFDIDAAPAR